MKDPVTHWHDEHGRFARLLDYLDGQLATFGDGGRPDYELMEDVLRYLKSYADRQHHPREDVAFRLLGAHEPALLPAIGQLDREHRLIDEAGATLHGMLEDILGDVVSERSAVMAAARAYLERYRAHIEAEEREILPAAARLLTADDWRQVMQAVPALSDPLFGNAVGLDYRRLEAQLSAEAAHA